MVVILKGYNDAPLDQVAHLGEALAGVPVPEFWMPSTRTRSTGRLGGTADATARRNNDGEDREGVRHHARGAIAPLRANVMWNTCLGQFRVHARLRRKLERAELIIDAQQKLCVALGLPTSDDRTDEE